MTHHALLRRCSLFAELPDSTLAELSALAVLRQYERNGVVYQKGERCHGLFIVVDGRIKELFQGPDGRERTLDILTSGETSGESPALTGDNYPNHAIALVKSHVLFLARESLVHLLQRDGRFATRYALRLSERILRIMGEIETNCLLRPLGRVVAYLLAQPTSPAGAILLDKPKYVLAARLNMTPESLSRALSDLSAAGVLRVQRWQIDILDRAGLAEFGK